jgi:hypothetical protein
MVKKSAENPVSAENPTMSSPIVICHQYPTNPHEISIKSNHFPSAIHSNPHQKIWVKSPRWFSMAWPFFLMSYPCRYIKKSPVIKKKSWIVDDMNHDISIETSINLGKISRPRVSPRSPVLLPPVVAASEHHRAAHGNGPARLRPEGERQQRTVLGWWLFVVGFLTIELSVTGLLVLGLSVVTVS